MSPSNLRTPYRSRKREKTVPKLPAKDPRDVGAKAKQYSASLLEWMWVRIDDIAEAEGYTRNELMREVARSFINECDADNASEKEQGKKPASK